MRDIEVKFNDRGLEVLFDGKPSPRFERYMRNVRCTLKLVRLAGRILVKGPAVAFVWAFLISTIDGSVQLKARTSENLLHVQLDFTAPNGLLQYLQLIYLLGMWFGIDDILRERRGCPTGVADTQS